MILDLDVFTNNNLGIDASDMWGDVYHHILKRIDPIKPLGFPMKRRYDYLNGTLEGMALVRNTEDPSGVSSGVLPGPIVDVPSNVGGASAADEVIRTIPP